MAKLADVNTRNIADAIRLGCRAMSNAFNADDNDIPYFGANVRPEARFGGSSEAHIPGRHLNAMLNAEDAAGTRLDEDAVDKHARAAFFSYAAAPLPLHRIAQDGQPVELQDHNVREGFHALYALVKYRSSRRGRELAEASISTILRYWSSEGDWDTEALRRDHGVSGLTSGYRSFISRLGRSIGPLVKYYRVTGYGPALELAIILKEKAIDEAFTRDGAYSEARFGTHCHSTTCVMSSLAQLADLTHDSALMDRVKSFYDNGLWEIRDELGWSIETSVAKGNCGRGEANNTGDILETALILGRWGYSEYYHDAERILRCHLLPSQLRDTSFVVEPPNPEGTDANRDVGDRFRGGFGFPAPYGHEPLGIMDSNKPRVGFNLDIVGGAVGSLCEAYREVTRYDQAGHWVNLLFDHETKDIAVKSPYSGGILKVRTKRPGPLFVRIPPWADRDVMRVSGAAATSIVSNGYLFIASPAVNRTVSIDFPLPRNEITLSHPSTEEKLPRSIRVRMRGDEVVAMDNFGADLTFFDPIE